MECGRITADEWASIFSTPTAAKRPLALNLFSGTGSVTEALIGMGYDVHTLDVRRVNHPTFCVDILKWDYRAIPPHTEIEFEQAARQRCRAKQVEDQDVVPGSRR